MLLGPGQSLLNCHPSNNHVVRIEKMASTENLWAGSGGAFRFLVRH